MLQITIKIHYLSLDCAVQTILIFFKTLKTHKNVKQTTNLKCIGNQFI
jgi:hypothetical protein